MGMGGTVRLLLQKTRTTTISTPMHALRTRRRSSRMRNLVLDARPSTANGLLLFQKFP